MSVAWSSAPLLAAAGAVSAVLLTGCGGASHTAGGGGSTQGSSNRQALVALRQYARCVRAHGLPGFPDPVVQSNGHPVFPDSAPRIPQAIQQACRAVAARIPPDYTATTAVSSSDFQKLLHLARCIRAHGIPDWPDPNPLGEFPIDTHIQQGGKRLFVPAVHACARLDPNPSGGINVVQARP
jgi:hypothetical protein